MDTLLDLAAQLGEVVRTFVQQQFQIAIGTAQGQLGLLAFRDVVGRAEHAQRPARIVVRGISALIHIADLAIGTQQAVLDLAGILAAGAHGAFHCATHGLPIVRMYRLQEVLHRRLHGSRLVAEHAVFLVRPGQFPGDQVQVPVAEIGHSLGPGQEGFAHAQRLFGAHTLGDVGGDATDAVDLARFVMQGELQGDVGMPPVPQRERFFELHAVIELHDLPVVVAQHLRLRGGKEVKVGFADDLVPRYMAQFFAALVDL